MKTSVAALIAVLALVAVAAAIAMAWLGTRAAPAPALPDAQASPARPAETAPVGVVAQQPASRAGVEPPPAEAPPDVPNGPQAVLTGRVVDARRMPVAAVEVRLVPWLPRAAEELAGASVTSAEDGRFRLALELPSRPELRRVHVIVSHDSHAALEREVVLAAGEQDLGDLVLADAGRVAGTVLGPGGAPLEGLRVVTLPAALAHQADALDGPADVDGETTSDAQGRFALASVPVGPHLVGAGGQGWAWGYEHDLEIAGGATAREVVLRLQRLPDERTIELVVLTPAGEPVGYARIEATYQTESHSGSASGQADPDGVYRHLVRVLAPHSFTAHDPSGTLGPAQARDVEPGTRGLVLRLTERRTLELLVHDEQGRPVVDYQAWAWNIGRSRRQLAFADAPPHPDGRATMALPAEPFELELEAEGFARPDLGVLDPQTAPATLQVVLRSLPGVSGVVLRDGEPVAGARVLLLRAELDRIYSVNAFPARSRCTPDAQTRSGDDGGFRLTLREGGDWFVRAEADGFAPAEAGPLRLDPAVGRHGLELRLGPGGAIEGRLLLPPGESAAGAIVGISRGDGFALTRRTDAEGGYRFEHLTPGRWLVKRCAAEILPGHVSSSSTSGDPGELPFSCEVGEGQVTRFDLDLSAGPPVLLEGGLRLGGSPAEGWTASLTRTTDWQPAGEATLDASGRFRLALDEAGAYQLGLTAPSSQAPLAFHATLALVDGRNVFERSVELGALAGVVATPPRDEDPPVRVLWSRDELTFSRRLPLQPDGSYRIDPVPAGEVRLVTRAPGQQPVELGRVVVPAGGEAILDLP